MSSVISVTFLIIFVVGIDCKIEDRLKPDLSKIYRQGDFKVEDRLKPDLSNIYRQDFKIDDRLKADFFNIYRHVAVETREFQEKPVTPENITYFLYTRNNPDQYVQLSESNLDLLDNKKIVFLIHGWTNSRKSKWYEDLKNAFLTSYKDYNVVQVDWKEPANQLYYVSSINTYDVGKILAKLIVNLNENHGVRFEDILLVGHSLGGQITGFVGKNVFKLTGKKLHRIIALDPAGPLFTQRPEDKRLNKNDAKIVEVIHSDGGTFGYKDAIGTIDFFPNGGNSQPGCKRIDLLDISSVTELVTCDHQRAYQYFIESILNPNELWARKCDDWDAYESGNCNPEEVAMGDLTTRATGRFFLETNRDKPFAKARGAKKSLTDKILNIFQ